MNWSNLHLNYITHLGSLKDFRRATVTIDVPDTVYTLSKWYKGCGFSPETVSFSSIEEAKQAGEEWVNNGK